MLFLIQSALRSNAIVEQGAQFAISFLIANTWYKFGSFALELIAFMATWMVLDVLYQALSKLVFKRKPRR
jgi:hypothetical protein